MSNYELFRISQNVVLVNLDREALILQHRKGRWLLPGGKINQGENWKQALDREILEETSIADYTIDRLIDADSWMEDDQAYYSVTFLASVKTKDVVLSDEHIAFAWVTLDQLDKYDFWHQSLPERIKSGFALLN